MDNLINDAILQTMTKKNKRQEAVADTAQSSGSGAIPANFFIAASYVPAQVWENLLDEEAAFSAGTIFPSLNKPFLGGGK